MHNLAPGGPKIPEMPPRRRDISQSEGASGERLGLLAGRCLIARFHRLELVLVMCPSRVSVLFLSPCPELTA